MKTMVMLSITLGLMLIPAPSDAQESGEGCDQRCNQQWYPTIGDYVHDLVQADGDNQGDYKCLTGEPGHAIHFTCGGTATWVPGKCDSHDCLETQENEAELLALLDANAAPYFGQGAGFTSALMATGSHQWTALSNCSGVIDQLIPSNSAGFASQD